MKKNFTYTSKIKLLSIFTIIGCVFVFKFFGLIPDGRPHTSKDNNFETYQYRQI